MGLRIETLLQELGGPLSLRLIEGREGLQNQIGVPDLNRPGLALAGFFDYFPAERLQVMGKTEVTFWRSLDAGTRRQRLVEIFSRRFKPVGFILCHGTVPPKDLCVAAAKAKVPVLTTPIPTTKFVTELMTYLEEKFAPSITLHGCLMDVFGVGVLLLGESGVGKSECALALLDKGHRLCADDVVEIRRTPEKTLLGTGAHQLRYHMEIRGLGIVDIKGLFGARAVRDRKLVELVIELAPWKPGKQYDRTGLEQKTHPILDVPLPLIELPIQTGRNLAVLVEMGAMNFRLKQTGVNTAERLNAQILQNLRRERGRSGGAEGRTVTPPGAVRQAARRKRHEER